MIETDRTIYIRWLAARFLLCQKNLSFVTDVRDFSLPKGILLVSFSAYAKATGCTTAELSRNGLLPDSYTFRSKKNRIVLYNDRQESTCPQRLRFSLAHELGHIFLQHKDDGFSSEAEANYFASEVVAHDTIVLPLLKGEWETDLERIREQMGLSWETAAIKLRSINRNPNAYTKEENILRNRFFGNPLRAKTTRQKFAAACQSVYIAYEA